MTISSLTAIFTRILNDSLKSSTGICEYVRKFTGKEITYVRTPAGQARYYATYAETFKLWPVPAGLSYGGLITLRWALSAPATVLYL